MEFASDRDAFELMAVLAVLDPRGDRPGVVAVVPGDPPSYRVIDHVDTGRRRTSTAMVGNQLFTTDVAAYVPRPSPVYATISELSAAVGAAGTALDAQWAVYSEAIAAQSKATWPPPERTAATWPAQVREVAEQVADELAAEAAELLTGRPGWARRTCDQCGGSGMIVGRCVCVILGAAGVHNLDVGSAGHRPEDGYEPDPDCQFCGGAGHVDKDCRCCGTAGVQPGPITSTTRINSELSVSIVSSPAGMITHGHIKPRLRWSAGFESASWTLSEADIIEAAAAQAGHDTGRLIVREGQQLGERVRWISGSVVQRITADRVEAVDLASPGVWRELFPTGQQIADQIADAIERATTDLLLGTDRQNRRDDARRAGYQLDSDLVVTARHMSVHQIAPIQDLLTNVAAAAAERGRIAALTTNFVATEEWGPAVVMLDKTWHIIDAFAPFYEIEHALADALDQIGQQSRN